MADSNVDITAGTGTSIDTRTEGTNGHHRQVIVIGDPATNAGVAPVDATAGLKVNLGADNDVTVTGTVDLGATDNQVLDDISADTGTIAGDTTSLDTKLAADKTADLDSGAGTDTVKVQGIAVPASGGAAVITGDATNGLDVDVTRVSGTVTVDNAGLTELAAAINSDKVDVNIVSSDVATGGTSAADDADFTAGTTPGTPAMGVFESSPTSVTDGDLGTVGITAGRRLKTSATIDAALPAGTNAIGKLAANSGVDIGDVDITSIAAGDNNIGNVDIVTLPGDVEADIDQIRDQIDLITPDIEEIRVDADAIRVATELIDNTVFVDDADFTDGTSSGLGIMGVAENTPTTVTDGDMGMVGIDPATRAIKIHDGGNSITVDGSLTVDLGANNDVTVTSGTVTANLGATDNQVLDNIEAGIDELKTQTVLAAGTNAIGKLAANSGVDIGDVDVTSLPALATGTNYIGKVSPPDVDVTTHTNYAKKYYTNAGAVTDGIIWSPAAGKRWHVVSMFINTSAAATVTLEDDKAGGDEVVMKMELAANSGTVINFGEKYPLASGEDAADLLVTTSAGNIYITVTGYEI